MYTIISTILLQTQFLDFQYGRNFRERFSKDLEGLSDLDLEDLAACDVNGRRIQKLIENTQTWWLAKKESVTTDEVVAGIQLPVPRAQRQEPV